MSINILFGPIRPVPVTMKITYVNEDEEYLLVNQLHTIAGWLNMSITSDKRVSYLVYLFYF